MADKVEIDLIVEAISKGFDKIEKDLKGVGTASKKAGDEAKQGNEGFKAFGDSMKGLATIAAGAAVVIGGALVAGLVKSVMAASDAEESLSKFNVVFKDLEGGPEGLALEVDKLAEATGRSKYELIGAVGALGDLFQPLGFSTDAAADLSLQMTTLAIDLSSFNNMPMDEALQRLQGTLVGSHENALAFGVVINENTLKAQMMKEGTDKLTGAQFEQAKVQARLNLLMAGTTAAQGDAIRTADGFANQMKALEGSMKDLAVEIGQKFLPAAIQAISKIREMADDAIPTLIAAAEKAGPALLKMVEGGIKQITLAASTANLNNLYSQLKDLGVEAGDLSDILGDSRAQFDLWRTDADMADDLARNEAGVRKLNYAIIGMNLGLSDTPRIVGTVANGFQDSTSELEDFVTAMEAMNLGLPVAATGMEYWTLATRDVTDAITEADEAVTVATVDTSLLAIDVIQATNAIEGMTPAVEAATGAIYASDEAIKAYAASTGDYATQAMNAGQEGINLNSIMYAAADAAGAEAATLVGLALAQGTVSAAKAEAILKEAALIQKAEEYGAMLAAGTITINEAVTGMQNFAASMDTGSIAVNTATGSVLLMNDSMVSSATSTQNLLDKFGLFPDEVGTRVNLDTSEAESRLSSLEARLAGLGSGGQPGTASGGYQPGLDPGGGGHVAPGAAVGANYVVPPGYNENWYQPVSTGERVVVTPDGSNPGGGMTVNNNFNGPVNPGQVMREIEISRAMMGI